MTETEWLECNDPTPMLECLQGKASDRKLRLFACACCRRIWHLLTDEGSRNMVEVAARFADGLATQEDLAAALNAAPYYEGHLQEGPVHIVACDAAFHVGDTDPWWAACSAASDALFALGEAPWIENKSDPEDYIDAHGACNVERNIQASLLREILGNPFHPITINSSWLNPTVRALAQSIYDDGNFTNFPILADALEEAGYTNEKILNHCRQPGDHVRGCWVVDLLVGKS
jgi:hypothetical protein